MQLKCTPRQNRKIRILRAAARAHPHQAAGRHAACAGPRVCRARHDLEIWHPCRPVTSSGARKSRFSRKIATLRPPQAAILVTPPPVTWSAHAPESIDHGTTSAQPKPVHNQGALSCAKSHFSPGWARARIRASFGKCGKSAPPYRLCAWESRTIKNLHRTTLRHEDLPFSSAHQLWLHGTQSEKSESLPDGFVGSEEVGCHLEQGPVVSADFSDT